MINMEKCSTSSLPIPSPRKTEGDRSDAGCRHAKVMSAGA